ncbi:hypothetical protein KC338_g6217 [Hortaea werneckii]|uniref:Apple domain-containing protein n=1 Tax=Hortaea werneckii TaxID=91943 RepID=A0A3M7F244_HORWE|nr:hypothetical protein KC323_g6455 [Hortaea werneckii]KAI6862482.1 hypothetical protein KC338_g6217 [Hortaea werneckii]RMY82892.1 hypothetical protein D0862_11869 [Hortaea werneckii]
MHSVLLNSLLFGLAVAAPNPLPQGIDFGAVDAAPMPTALGPQPEKTVDVVSYDSTSAAAAASSQVLATASASANVKRTDDDSDGDDAACDTEKLEVGKGELTRNPDTAAAFHDNDHYAQAAKAAKAPAGYKEAFNNLQSSVEMIGYHGLRTIGEYDPELCAEHCKKDEGCVSFNMYFERSPSYATSDTCRDPPSTTYIKCTFYGFPISAEASTNKQQHRHDFDVVRAGSNAYNREDIPAPKVDDFDAPTELDCAINAPLDPKTGKDTYVGMSAFKTSYDPGQCASACNAHNDYSRKHPDHEGNYHFCNFFNSYILYKNNVPESLVCSMYTREWDSSYAVNCGQHRGNDDYTIGQSATYALSEKLSA